MILARSFLAAVVLALGIAGSARADIIWNWSFASESGSFQTDGTTPTPGTYTLIDFSVTASGTGGTIGSLSGGDYFTPVFVTSEPFSFVWDGSQVTQWLHSGANGFDWWAFGDSAKAGQSYFFGWDTGNLNDPARGAHYDQTILDPLNNPLAVGDITVTTQSAAIPEPSTWLLLAGGLAAGCAFRRRRPDCSSI